MSKNGYKTVYTRNFYGSRGAMRTRDAVWEGFVEPTCVVCSKKISRPIDNNRRPRQISQWLKLKTCGKGTECLKKYLSGEGNPNYKGIMPKCKNCGKKVSYSKKEGQEICVGVSRCIKCSYKYLQENYWNSDEYSKFAAKRALKGWEDGKLKGGFVKGQVSSFKGKKHKKSSIDKLKKTRKEKIASGEIVFKSHKVLFTCKCGKELMVFPSRLKYQKVCSLSCAGKLGGRPSTKV